mmetsp:Transcript_29921/g.64500  ORF Transcript_29921/g.64500 Transcript_29921/m.64500 type:complete len:225 (-) Transcript_29921:102-776(-)
MKESHQSSHTDLWPRIGQCCRHSVCMPHPVDGHQPSKCQQHTLPQSRICVLQQAHQDIALQRFWCESQGIPYPPVLFGFTAQILQGNHCPGIFGMGTTSGRFGHPPGGAVERARRSTAGVKIISHGADGPWRGKRSAGQGFYSKTRHTETFPGGTTLQRLVSLFTLCRQGLPAKSHLGHQLIRKLPNLRIRVSHEWQDLICERCQRCQLAILKQCFHGRQANPR